MGAGNAEVASCQRKERAPGMGDMQVQGTLCTSVSRTSGDGQHTNASVPFRNIKLFVFLFVLSFY